MLKSLEELKAYEAKLQKEAADDKSTKIVVGLATCGIAAGAKPVMDTFVAEIEKRGIKNVKVSKTGCIGMCKLEPLVEVREYGKPIVTYIRMTPEKAVQVIESHIVNGIVVSEYTVGNAE